MNASKIKTPVGELTLVADERNLVAILWENEEPKMKIDEGGSPVLENATKQLREYFSGERSQFDLPLNFLGTKFQRKVWDELRRIPYGQTSSYREIAQKIGSPKAFRAVGAANGKNPIPIVVPCHRVIGSDGSLTGFGGGLEVKMKLLQLEGELHETRRHCG